MTVEHIKETIDNIVEDLKNDAILTLHVDNGDGESAVIDNLIIDPHKLLSIEKEVVAALILSKDDWDMAANAIDKFNELLDFSDDK